jgi:hypothetical protein
MTPSQDFSRTQGSLDFGRAVAIRISPIVRAILPEKASKRAEEGHPEGIPPLLERTATRGKAVRIAHSIEVIGQKLAQIP